MSTLSIVLIVLLWVLGIIVIGSIEGMAAHLANKSDHQPRWNAWKTTFWYVVFVLWIAEIIILLPSRLFFWIGHTLAEASEKSKRNR